MKLEIGGYYKSKEGVIYGPLRMKYGGDAPCFRVEKKDADSWKRVFEFSRLDDAKRVIALIGEAARHLRRQPMYFDEKGEMI